MLFRSVNPDNTPFRQDDGSLLFRPAGHGALIENLAEINADLVFIKNIDNVTTDARRGDTVRYKKALAGILLDLQTEAFAHLKTLEEEANDLAPIAEFIEKRLCVKLPRHYDRALLQSILDRPIRVCGMVRNEGEPGGGPFWVANPDGTESLQIAESSQIAPEDMPLMQSATHFNPVDLVCGVRNAQGEKFDLRAYTDPATGFISSKSSGGRELRAQELPGLWNGAMARWNTIFVDVPITTFSPVKVVQDLLRPQHQNKNRTAMKRIGWIFHIGLLTTACFCLVYIYLISEKPTEAFTQVCYWLLFISSAMHTLTYWKRRKTE